MTNKKYYLFENLTGRNPAGLVGAKQLSSDIVSMFAGRLGSNIHYREVPRYTYMQAIEELRVKDENICVEGLRRDVRALELIAA